MREQTKSQQFQQQQKMSKFNFLTIIWNHHEKCIQISTNMPMYWFTNFEIGVKCEW